MSEAEDRTELLKKLDEEGDIAADYLEELLDIADLDGDIEISVEADRASVAIVSDGTDRRLKRLVGRHGEVLEALQELTRLAVQSQTGERSRLMLDIGGYRAARKEEIAAIARDAVAEAESSGEPVSLEPMNPFERKVVHDIVAAAGLSSDSEGYGPQRHVIITFPEESADFPEESADEEVVDETVTESAESSE
jgi:spoIIIJ-associated protein